VTERAWPSASKKRRRKVFGAGRFMPALKSSVRLGALCDAYLLASPSGAFFNLEARTLSIGIARHDGAAQCFPPRCCRAGVRLPFGGVQATGRGNHRRDMSCRPAGIDGLRCRNAGNRERCAAARRQPQIHCRAARPQKIRRPHKPRCQGRQQQFPAANPHSVQQRW
jgi:hypothetical protein